MKTIRTIQDVEPNLVASVYSGTRDGCCCGCSGKYYYSPVTRRAAGEQRGYPVRNDEVNGKTFTTMYNKILRLAERYGSNRIDGMFGQPIFTVMTPTRFYMIRVL